MPTAARSPGASVTSSAARRSAPGGVVGGVGRQLAASADRNFDAHGPGPAYATTGAAKAGLLTPGGRAAQTWILTERDREDLSLPGLADERLLPQRFVGPSARSGPRPR